MQQLPFFISTAAEAWREIFAMRLSEIQKEGDGWRWDNWKEKVFPLSLPPPPTVHSNFNSNIAGVAQNAIVFRHMYLQCPVF